MSTTLSAPPSRTEETQHKQVRRVGLVDRLALRLGVALITWGRRPQPAGSTERRALKYERAVARALAEQWMCRERERVQSRYYELLGRM